MLCVSASRLQHIVGYEARGNRTLTEFDSRGFRLWRTRIRPDCCELCPWAIERLYMACAAYFPKLEISNPVAPRHTDYTKPGTVVKRAHSIG